MMADARADAVEAAAMATRELSIPHTNKIEPWGVASASERAVWLSHAESAITAYLASMAEAGWVMARDVGAMGIDGPSPARSYAYAWNACRIAMLADPPPKR